MRQSGPKTAIFIMPGKSSAWSGSEGLWITTAGWASSAKRKFGNSVVVTQDRIATAEEVLDFPLRGGEKVIKQAWMSIFPSPLKTLVKDFLNWRSSKNWKILDELDFSDGEVAFVWEKHDLFSGRGILLAQKLKVPYIAYVHAPVIWEAKKWGVKRFGWGNMLRNREAAMLKRADAVAAVSQEVKVELVKMGVQKDKILISPMAVDPSLFKVEGSESLLLKKALGVEEKDVIGWTGSFRRFHGLDQIIKGFYKVAKKFPNTVLLLVGDGGERLKIEGLVSDLNLQNRVIFTGKKPFREIPHYLSILEVALAGASSSTNFHYSPQKLRDYMAAGKPVLAPSVGEIPAVFKDGVHLKLYTAANVESFTNELEKMLYSKIEREKIAKLGKEFIEKTGTWDHELEKLIGFLQVPSRKCS